MKNFVDCDNPRDSRGCRTENRRGGKREGGKSKRGRQRRAGDTSCGSEQEGTEESQVGKEKCTEIYWSERGKERVLLSLLPAFVNAFFPRSLPLAAFLHLRRMERESIGIKMKERRKQGTRQPFQSRSFLPR